LEPGRYCFKPVITTLTQDQIDRMDNTYRLEVPFQLGSSPNQILLVGAMDSQHVLMPIDERGVPTHWANCAIKGEWYKPPEMCDCGLYQYWKALEMGIATR
jgi:hypothetical protein